ncbi:hypothetical protein BH09MYX1_BH09MYX1_14350 [soil metagenome]
MTPAIVGREDDLARIFDAFASGVSIVTVLGPGGMGKTTLAQRFVEIEEQRDGATCFCDVSETRDESALVHAVAASIAPSRESRHESARELGAALAECGRSLLVLDNFEQAIAAAAFVSDLARHAPALRILVTSRERLAIRGEVVLELGPLPERDAVRLFRDRAAAVGGAIGSGDASIIETLVTRLDRIPLALELAAARTRVMTPSQLVARLDERFALLRRSRGGSEKHAALESAIAGSWDALAENERRALAELSVFAGSFTVAAAEEVLSADLEPLQRITALRDKSLVHMAEPGRLALFVSIREYAAARLAELDPAVVSAVRSRHARHFAERAHALNVSRLFQGTTPDSALRQALLDDRDNILAALGHAEAAEGELDAFVELACAVTHLYLAPGAASFDRLTAALARIGDDALDARTRLLLVRQGLASSLGRFEESQRDLEDVLATPNLPAKVRALALNTQGIQERVRSEYRASWDSHVLAEKELATLDLPRLRAINTACMGRLQCDFGDEALGRDYNERARAICVDLGDRWLEALVLGNLGQLEQEHGNFDVARDLLVLAVERFREASEPLYLGVYLGVLGDLSFEAEATDDARHAYEEASAFFSRWRAHRQAVALYAAWGALEARHGERVVAESHFARAHSAAERCDSPTVRLLVELHQASLRLRQAKDSGNATRVDEEHAHWAARRGHLARGIGDALAEGELGTVACSIDVRFALRMLDQALARDTVPAAALVIASDGAWFRTSGGAKVDLLRRGSLRRLLTALADAHARCRGDALTASALIDVAWPGEKLLDAAASTRLRVAIATLRKMGLKPFLRTGSDGYLLDPEATIECGINKD